MNGMRLARPICCTKLGKYLPCADINLPNMAGHRARLSRAEHDHISRVFPPVRMWRQARPGVPLLPLVAILLRMSESPLRIVVAKPGLDGHDRGAKVVARALRDAGMEVVYTGLHQTPEQIVEAAIQEDADAVGLSVLSGAHMTLFAKVAALLAERDAKDIVVFGGGIIPEADIPELDKLGVAKVFTPGATTTEIVEWVRANVRPAEDLAH